MPKITDSESLCNTCAYGFTHVERALYKQQSKEWEDPKVVARFIMYSMCTHPVVTGADGVPWKWQDACVSCPLYVKKTGAPLCPVNTEEVTK